ncbi:MAG: flavin reductase family protein [Paracoccaceae bacterium]
MFYRPEDGHGLPHNPFTALIAPRPIGWISTRGPLGDNLAPYSFFNAVAYAPPQVMFASTGAKDSVTNLRDAGVFAVNLVAEAALHAMSTTSESFPPGTDEFTACNIPRAECTTINCPRVADAPATLECTVTQIITLKGHNNFLTLGEVTGIHIADHCLTQGRFDATKYHPAARMGYQDYAIIREVVELKRPDERPR